MIRNSSSSHLEVPWLVIVNLQARSGTLAKQWLSLGPKLKKLLPLAQVRESYQINDIKLLLQGAIEGGVRHVLAVGGDGTAHHVINAIMSQKQVESTAITFALYPCGTGNDWVKTHGIPTKWNTWKMYFVHGKIDRQNLGEIVFQRDGLTESRYFMNVAGLAYDAFVVRASSNKPSFLPSRLFYLWSVLRCLFQYEPQAGDLHFNGRSVSAQFYTINVGIGKYSGGGMQFVPHAEAAAEALALTYVTAVSRLKVILNSYRFYEGRIATFEHAVLTKTQAITIKPAVGNELLVEADGEFLGACPTTIRVMPQALVFIGAANK